MSFFTYTAIIISFKCCPATIINSVTARLLLSAQIAFELPADQLPDLLLALSDRGLLYAGLKSTAQVHLYGGVVDMRQSIEGLPNLFEQEL